MGGVGGERGGVEGAGGEKAGGGDFYTDSGGDRPAGWGFLGREERSDGMMD